MTHPHTHTTLSLSPSNPHPPHQHTTTKKNGYGLSLPWTYPPPPTPNPPPPPPPTSETPFQRDTKCRNVRVAVVQNTDLTEYPSNKDLPWISSYKLVFRYIYIYIYTHCNTLQHANLDLIHREIYGSAIDFFVQTCLRFTILACTHDTQTRTQTQT